MCDRARSVRCGTLLTMSMLALILAVPQISVAANDKKIIFGVFWEDCQEECEGFRQGIADSGIDAEIIIKGVMMKKSALPGLVQEARDMHADLILTFGTSVTLGMAGTLSQQGDRRFVTDIPLVFMYVADPIGSGIVSSFDNTGRSNVTGTFNRVPEPVNILAIRSFRPEFNKLGIIYNGNERNSVLKVEEMRELSQQMDFELIALEIDPDNPGPPDAALIPERVAEITSHDVDFMYLGSSSFLRLYREIYSRSAVEHGIPVLSPYEEVVRENDALFSVAARTYDVGILAAEQAIKILRDGEKPGDIPVAAVTDFAYVINMDVARRLKLYPSVELLQIAETVK